jgi:hypothetical protein
LRKILSRLTVSFAVLGLLGSLTSCGSNPRVVMIPPIAWTTIDGEQVPTDLIKLGPDVKGRVYVFTKDGWLLSDGELVIPEGWLASPPPPKKEN